MSFTPVIFKNFAKSVSDLFNVDTYVVDKHSVAVRTKSENGLTWTQTSELASGLTQDLKVLYKNKGFGSAEAKVSTAQTGSAKLKLDKLYPGLTVEFSAEDAASASQSLNATYRQDFFAGNLKADLKTGEKGSTRTVLASGVVGFEGVSVGATATVDVTAGAAVKDYNGGFQYEQNDLTVSVVTGDKANSVTLSVNQVVNSDVSVGAQGVYHFTDDSKKSLFVGASVALDKETSVKSKLSHIGVLSTSFEHQLRSFAKVGVKSVVNVASAATKPEFAVSLTLGEQSE